jgi:hypothetical protein
MYFPLRKHIPGPRKASHADLWSHGPLAVRVTVKRHI